MRPTIGRESHRLSETLLRPVREDGTRHQRVDAADPPVVTALERSRPASFEVIERLRIQPRTKRIDDEDSGFVERRGVKRASGVRVVMIGNADTLDRIFQS